MMRGLCVNLTGLGYECKIDLLSLNFRQIKIFHACTGEFPLLILLLALSLLLYALPFQRGKASSLFVGEEKEGKGNRAKEDDDDTRKGSSVR